MRWAIEWKSSWKAAFVAASTCSRHWHWGRRPVPWGVRTCSVWAPGAKQASTERWKSSEPILNGICDLSDAATWARGHVEPNSACRALSVADIAALTSVKRLQIQRFGADAGTGDGLVARDDVVATEEPLEIRLAYTRPDGRRAQKSISITMRTPGNDGELAAGFLLTEGIVASADQVDAIGPCGPPAANGLINVVRVDLAADVEVDLARLERHFYTSSSCGVCGKASLEAVAIQGRHDLHEVALKVSPDVLGELPEKLRARQSVFDRTGGLHASGLFDARGRIDAIREDVGRHNALDKPHWAGAAQG